MKKEGGNIHEKLRLEIQKKLGVHTVTARFFRMCADEIYKGMHIRVSISTLKRYWHYVERAPDYQPNKYTLDILVKFAGYTCWDSFCNGEEKNSSQTPKRLAAQKLLKQMQEQAVLMQKRMAELEGLLREEEE